MLYLWDRREMVWSTLVECHKQTPILGCKHVNSKTTKIYKYAM